MPLDRQEKSSRDAVARSVWPADPSLAAWRCWPQKQDSAPRRIRHAAVDSNSRGGRWRSGGLANQAPVRRLGSATTHASGRRPSAAVADLTHLIFVAVPMPPEFRVGTDLDGAHPPRGFQAAEASCSRDRLTVSPLIPITRSVPFGFHNLRNGGTPRQFSSSWLALPSRSPSGSPWAVLVHAPAFFSQRRGASYLQPSTAPASTEALPSRIILSRIRFAGG
jgi:hypothetical protein